MRPSSGWPRESTRTVAARWRRRWSPTCSKRSASARAIERLIVVSGDPIAQELAAEAGAEVVPDPEDAGHVEAAQAGIARAEVEGAERVVLLAGDCPLLDPRELDRLLTGIPSRYVGIVPDRHGTGTNALLLSPPDAIVPAFGEGSRARHVEAARLAGIPFGIEELPSIELDLDTPADVVALTLELEKTAQAGPPHGQGAGDMSRELRVLPGRGAARGRGGNEARRADRCAGRDSSTSDIVVISQKVVSKAEG